MRPLWFLKLFPQGFRRGDLAWGSMRLYIVLFLLVGYVILCGILFEEEAVVHTVIKWTTQWPTFSEIPQIMLFFPACLVTYECLRYLIIPLFSLIGPFVLGARYIQDIYELPSIKSGIRYLMASIFAMSYPKLTISNGKKVTRPDEINLMDIIGGPGYIEILPGNVVLFERHNSPSNVRAGGTHFVSRGEKVKEIASLDDQHGYIESMRITSQDGIDVEISDIHYGYRLRLGHSAAQILADRTPADPYPFSVQAMRNLTYNRFVLTTGIMSWHSAVGRVISGVINDYVNQNTIDHLTAPSRSTLERKNPRLAIADNFESRGVRIRLANLGAELLWVNIGQFNLPDQVNERRLGIWDAKWKRRTDLTLTEGEARRIAYQEQARAEAQAAVLMNIVRIIEEIKPLGQPKEILRRIFLARTAQMLEAMSAQLPHQEAVETATQSQGSGK